jgi:probable rRNA maturation factor
MVFNRQHAIPLDEAALSEFLLRVLRELKLEGVEVSVAFVTDAEIAKWNKKYRDKNGPTDVLSFPAMDRRHLAPFKRKAGLGKAGAEAGYLGDIAIAPETAQRYAVENGRHTEKDGPSLENEFRVRGLETELRVLMLHGVLHLMGYDHETDHGQMSRIEQDLRRRLEIA